MNYIRNVCVALLLLFQIVAYSEERTLTERDNGTKVSLEVGDILHVALDGNPTTGYMWECVVPMSSTLLSIEQTYIPSSDLCGAGGVFMFSFQAAGVGHVQLHCVYRRPWESDTLPEKVFDVSLVILEAHETL